MKSLKKKNLLFIGGGRWAQIYLEQLQKFRLNIYVVTKNRNLKEKLINSKFSKIYTFKKFKDIKINKNFLIILCNRTNQRLNILKKEIKNFKYYYFFSFLTLFSLYLSIHIKELFFLILIFLILSFLIKR